MMEDRIQKAVSLFKEGYNCSQSVFAAYADRYDIPEELAYKMSASFGGGIGRMRETCGAACGMFMLVGMETGATDAKDRAGKSGNYKVVQELAEVFKERNGSLCCAELLGLKPNTTITSEAQERTKEYYKKRPCTKMVEEAARIFSEYLEKKEKAE